jgi:hypothetical protein
MGAGTNGLSNGASAAVAAGAGERADDGTTVFRGTAYSPLRTTVALALWLGAIHFNAFLVLASLFLFPRRVAALYAAPRLPPLLRVPGIGGMVPCAVPACPSESARPLHPCACFVPQGAGDAALLHVRAAQ